MADLNPLECQNILMGESMPKKARSFRKQRGSSKNIQAWTIVFIVAIIAVIVVVAHLANQSTTLEIPFPARELSYGNPKVTVEIYADFQCPICGEYARTIEPQLRENYVKTGKVNYIFRNLIVVDNYVSGGQESHLSALAALCAGDQDMFWEFHDLLYLNQTGENVGDFTSPKLFGFAVQLHLDAASFQQCLSNQTHQDVILADMRSAQARGVTGTPTLFVDGQRVYIQHADYRELFNAIDAALVSSGG
jgi:protein-disulfide isomerase